ncbi:hypothetical protein N7495_002029 [Penicillium taxi]|uniref:uncharacterized protein n=1 Tax=Penicillium taxi TaxID=168475 RepID=UPI002544EB8A|nr:uncharacterized protein N7495_002029 [Penicillium taxi]KAJ5901501.1 hypothetical protein N7495_002029 [Penicillium taxi]
MSSSERYSSSARAPLAGVRQITRNRASYSCHTCRRRKVKCDKIHPICGNCSKTGGECIYDLSSQKREERDSSTRIAQGVKRRRENPRGDEEELVNEGDIEELQSIYGHLRQAESSPTQKSDPRAIKNRLDKLRSMIETLSGNPQTLEAAEKRAEATEGTIESSLLEELRHRKAQNERSPSQSASSRRAAAESSGDEFPIPSGPANDLVDPIGSLNLGHLSLEDGGRSRYVGTTYWAYISHEINDLNQLLRDQNRSPDVLLTENTQGSNNSSMKGRQARDNSIHNASRSTSSQSSGGNLHQSILSPFGDSPSLNEKVVEPEMLENVPTRRQSHILYKGFMSGIHAISPVIHPPTILKFYNAFWNWYDFSSYSGEPCPNPSFIPLLYAIWYGGSVTISIRTINTEFNAISRCPLSTVYNEEVTRWLKKISFPRSPSLQGLSAYLIVQTILAKEEEPLASSLFVSLAMRVAQSMGLHRDPAKFGIEPCEAECRRRLWWHILHMDGVVAMSSGLPPLISGEDYWDVQEISEIKDTLLGTPAADHYEQLLATNQQLPDNPDDPSVCGGPSMVNVFYLAAKGKYIMARAVRRILKIQLGTKPVTRLDMEELRAILLDLQLKLNAIASRIPEGMMTDSASVLSDRALSISKSPTEPHSTESELPGEGLNGCREQYHSPVLLSFHKWAKIILLLYIDKVRFPVTGNIKILPSNFGILGFLCRISTISQERSQSNMAGSSTKVMLFVIAMDSWRSSFNSRQILTFNHSTGVGQAITNPCMRRCIIFPLVSFVYFKLTLTRIMLIDLYERPYSPEASKSRAFIDRILVLSGPDGGVVGGEDGISSQRPLKDGGREAWDMIRRLRQKAWQKAGLNPEMLWTEQDQIQAGITSPAGESRNPTLYWGPGPPLISNADSHSAIRPERRLSEFGRLFYHMTRSHIPSPSGSSPGIRSSPLRYSYRSPSQQDSSSLPNPQYASLPAAFTIPSSPPVGFSSPALSPTAVSHIPIQRPLQSPNNRTFPRMLSIEPVSPNPPPLGLSTPPSMVDPNLHFDWDQWDAVFGQHLPFADDLMELDAVSGLESANIGIPTRGAVNSNAVPEAPSFRDTILPPVWADNGSSNPLMTSIEWTGIDYENKTHVNYL